MENSSKHHQQTQYACQNDTTIKCSKPRRVWYKCKVCRKAFRNHGVFQAHFKLHKNAASRGQNALRLFSCRLCGTNHRGLSAFIEHQKIHEEELRQYSQELPDNQQQPQILDKEQDDLSTEVIITTSEDGSHLQLAAERDENEAQSGPAIANENILQAEEGNILSPSGLNSNMLSNMSIPVSLMNALCSAATTQTSSQMNSHPVTVSAHASCKTIPSNEGLQIEIPSQVKAIYFNSSNPSLNDVLKQLDALHHKMDVILKHLNIPFDEDGNPVPLPTATIEIQQTQQAGKQLATINETGTPVIIESFPPSYSVVQAAKEAQQQEYYALTMSNRQAQQVFKNDSTHILAASANELKGYKGKTVDLLQYMSDLSSLADQQEQVSEDVNEASSSTELISNQIIDKIFVESRSRANFAKNLTFAIFSAEERRGKNCTGRVFGKAQHKGQLDTVKLAAVKEATFRKYPCRPDLVDITWRKECVTAIDSGLRNENRSTSRLIVTNPIQDHHHHHHQIVNEVVNENP